MCKTIETNFDSQCLCKQHKRERVKIKYKNHIYKYWHFFSFGGTITFISAIGILKYYCSQRMLVAYFNNSSSNCMLMTPEGITKICIISFFSNSCIKLMPIPIKEIVRVLYICPLHSF